MSWKLPRRWPAPHTAAPAPATPTVTGLGPRLSWVFGRVPAGASVVDVGTDHARLPAALRDAGRVGRAIAIDPSLEALRRAGPRARRSGVELRRGRGLEPLSPGEATVAIFAGMGGELIARSLEARPPAPLGVSRLIVQANTEHPRVRRALLGAGYELVEERHVAEGRRYFLVMVAEKTAAPRPLDDEAALLGPRWARREDALFRCWLEARARRERAASAGAAQAPARALELIERALQRFDGVPPRGAGAP